MGAAVRLVVAGGYVAAWIVFVLVTDWNETASDGVSISAWIGISVGAGLIIGRWWAVALALSLLVLGFEGCDESKDYCDVAWVPLVLIFFVPMTAGMIATGVGVRKLLKSRTGRT